MHIIIPVVSYWLISYLLWVVPAFFPSLYEKIHSTFDGDYPYPSWSFIVLVWPLLIVIPPGYYAISFLVSLDQKILAWGERRRGLANNQKQPKQLTESIEFGHHELGYRDANCNGCGRPMKK